MESNFYGRRKGGELHFFMRRGDGMELLWKEGAKTVQIFDDSLNCTFDRGIELKFYF